MTTVGYLNRVTNMIQSVVLSFPLQCQSNAFTSGRKADGLSLTAISDVCDSCHEGQGIGDDILRIKIRALCTK